jgi:hypothetical protein
MSETAYRITRSAKSWVIERDGKAEGDYATKEAAFEAAAAAASNAIKDGLGVRISVPERAPGESALGGQP